VNVAFLNPFLESVFAVLKAEVSITVERGELQLQRAAYTTDEISVLISLIGQVSGVVIIGMDEHTGIDVVSRILGQPFTEFDELAQSGIGELGNVIAGQASNRLFEAGYETKISTPTLVLGKGTLISTLDFDRVVVPLKTELGDFQMQLALKERV
jgi:chemotaxis protein CheX